MIKIKVRSAAYIQDIIGAREIEVETDSGTSVERFLNQLDEKYSGRLSPYLNKKDYTGVSNIPIRVFLNSRDTYFLDDDSLVLSDGDIILLLPVLAGG